MPKLKDIPKVDRPREKFLKKGPDSLSNSELLAILLGSGIKRMFHYKADSPTMLNPCKINRLDDVNAAFFY